MASVPRFLFVQLSYSTRSKQSVDARFLWSAFRRVHTKPSRTLKVPSFGTLKIIDVSSDVTVEPINPHENPNADVAYIYGNLEVDVGADVHPKEGLISARGGKSGEKVTIQIPVQYDLFAKLVGRASCAVSGLESQVVQVELEEGGATLKAVKAEKISVASGGGNISCLSVTQGNIQLSTSGKGDITGKRFQGPRVTVSTEDGKVDVESVYSDHSFFETRSGFLSLKNLHRQANVKVSGKGNVNITGLDGSLQAKLAGGNLSMQISNLAADTSVEMDEGTLTISTAGQPAFRANLKAPDVAVSDDVQHELDGDCVVFGDPSGPKLSCRVGNGQILVEKKDWFSSLGLKFSES